LVAGVSLGATSHKSSSKKVTSTKVISIDSVEHYVGKTVTLESKVIEIEHAGSKALSELEKNFKVVVDTTAKAALLKAGMYVESLQGGTVKITGKLYKDSRYGIQMDVTNASQVIVVTPRTPNPAASTSSTSTTRGTFTRSTVPAVVIPFEGVVTIGDATT